jgi:hypothetical protein
MDKKYNIFNIHNFNKIFWDFEPSVYKEFYKDLKEFNDYKLKKHYWSEGRYQNRIYNNKLKIIIYCNPWNINDNYFGAGGDTVLYRFAKLINEQTYKNVYAKIYTHNRINIENPFCNFFAEDNEINPRTLVVYSDGCEGNPLKSKNVMRWILLEIGTLYRDINFYKSWGLNDIVYHWEKSHILKNTKILNINYVDQKFKNLNNKRYKNSCYLVKKRILEINNKNIEFIHPKNSICIDEIKLDYIVNYFNICKKFYCYDLKTFFIIGAIICGCKVILVPDSRDKKTYIESTLLSDFSKFYNMFAWGEDDIHNIKYNNLDVNELILYLKNYELSFFSFLNDITKYFLNQNPEIPTVKTLYYNQLNIKK